jgi:hypothetical protein
MPLITTAEIVAEAVSARRGCGAFNAIQRSTSRRSSGGRPGEGSGDRAAQPERRALPRRAGADRRRRAAEARVAVHLDHAESRELVREAVALGFGSVMFDASGLDYADNVRETREVTAFCHDHGVWVEAELGEIGGKDGVHAPGARTDPGEAAEFAAATGVDALAVAVGSSHAIPGPGRHFGLRPHRAAARAGAGAAGAARLIRGARRGYGGCGCPDGGVATADVDGSRQPVRAGSTTGWCRRRGAQSVARGELQRCRWVDRPVGAGPERRTVSKGSGGLASCAGWQGRCGQRSVGATAWVWARSRWLRAFPVFDGLRRERQRLVEVVAPGFSVFVEEQWG